MKISLRRNQFDILDLVTNRFYFLLAVATLTKARTEPKRDEEEYPGPREGCEEDILDFGELFWTGNKEHYMLA